MISDTILFNWRANTAAKKYSKFMGKIANLTVSNNSRKISAQQFQSELKSKYTSEGKKPSAEHPFLVNHKIL